MMGSQCLRHHQVRSLGLEDLSRAGGHGRMGHGLLCLSLLCFLTLSPICLSVPLALTICPFLFPSDPVGGSALSAFTTRVSRDG